MTLSLLDQYDSSVLSHHQAGHASPLTETEPAVCCVLLFSLLLKRFTLLLCVSEGVMYGTASLSIPHIVRVR